ncbi:MAG TPA: hypothetical protein DGC76_09040 [Candidatus Accumulibacter sp.]|nr:hypothetical protein [Accumulibacter sp.]
MFGSAGRVRRCVVGVFFPAAGAGCPEDRGVPATMSSLALHRPSKMPGDRSSSLGSRSSWPGKPGSSLDAASLAADAAYAGHCWRSVGSVAMSRIRSATGSRSSCSASASSSAPRACGMSATPLRAMAHARLLAGGVDSRRARRRGCGRSPARRSSGTAPPLQRQTRSLPIGSTMA